MALSDSIKSLFLKAKEKDEFEFICTLINYRSMGSKYSNSNLYEWFDAISFYEDLYNKQAHIVNKTRIGLLIYTTFFESSDLYSILGNLSRIVLGYRCSPYLYFKRDKANKGLAAEDKISYVQEVLLDAGYEEIEQFFENMFVKQLRNTFCHSSYSIVETELILQEEKEPILIENVGTTVVDIENFIIPKISELLVFFNSFKSEFLTQYASYTENKKVKGRLPDLTDITIIGSSQGLRGFESGAVNIILDDTGFWSGTNIRFGHTSEVDRHVLEELVRFSKKADIRTNDGALEKLYQVITERNKPDEISNLSAIYQRFALIVQEKAIKESNYFKQQDLFKRAIRFYQKACDLNPELCLNPNMALLKYKVAESCGDINLKKEALSDLIKCLGAKMSELQIKNVIVLLKELKKQRIEVPEEKINFRELLSNYKGEDLKSAVELGLAELEKISG
jgi:hypothetical protein